MDYKIVFCFLPRFNDLQVMIRKIVRRVPRLQRDYLQRAPALRTQHPDNTQLLLDASKKLDQIFGGPKSYLSLALEGQEAE